MNKKMFFSLSVFVVLVMAFKVIFSQNVSRNVVFKEKEFDFGKIVMGTPVTHNFIFKNEDKAAIVISDAKATCGCTTPRYPLKPVMPNNYDTIVVGYNAATEGKFYKTIFVTIQGESAAREIVIKGEVVK